MAPKGPLIRHHLWLTAQADHLRASRKLIKVGAVAAAEIIKTLKGVGFLEGLGIKCDGIGCSKTARTAAIDLFPCLRMRCRIGAHKEPRIATCRRTHQGLAMPLPFENWQAVGMGAKPALKKTVSIEQ